MKYVIRDMERPCSFFGSRGSRSGMGLIIFVHEIFGDLHIRRRPYQKTAVIRAGALQHYDDVALLAILTQKLIDLVQDRDDHFLAASLEQRLIVFGLSLERFLQLRSLFHPTIAYGRLNRLTLSLHL